MAICGGSGGAGLLAAGRFRSGAAAAVKPRHLVTFTGPRAPVSLQSWPGFSLRERDPAQEGWRQRRMFPRSRLCGGSRSPAGRHRARSRCSLAAPGARPQLWPALASVSRGAQPEGAALQEGQGHVGSSSRMEGAPLVSFFQSLLLPQKLTKNN